ncbi:UNVERIFIED_CONTAM: hypothetical protein FKN15_010918 [Acipenser sinensis]
MGDSGLELRVSGYVRSMRQAVTLVLAVEKMKRPHRKAIGSEFSDLDLLNILMEHVNEERVMLEVSPDLESFETELRRRRSDEPHSIRDSEKKCWVMNELDGRPMELTASMLQGPNISQQVTLSLSTYIPQTQPGLGQPVVLGIGGSNYYLVEARRADPHLLLDGQELRFFTPVRRSLRIKRISRHYPPALRDHDPCVTSFRELLGGEEEEEEERGGAPAAVYVYRENEALRGQVHVEYIQEEVEGGSLTSSPETSIPPQTGAAPSTPALGGP